MKQRISTILVYTATGIVFYAGWAEEGYTTFCLIVATFCFALAYAVQLWLQHDIVQAAAHLILKKDARIEQLEKVVQDQETRFQKHLNQKKDV